jgi:hypothetical protein
MLPRIFLVLLVALTTAGSASAISLSLVQVGGTADAGSAQIGDTIVVSLVVTLEEGDVFTGVGAALEWDMDGGDVLDIASATETGSLVIDGKLFTWINGRYRIGDPGTVGTSVEEGQSFPASFVGPTFVVGWELVCPIGDLDGVVGPHSFSIGEAEFVIRNFGTATVSYYTQEPWETLVAGQGFEFNGQITYEDLEVGTVVQVKSLAIVARATPAVPSLGPVGLGIVAAGLAGAGIASVRRTRTRRPS